MAFNNALTVINTTNQSGIREELADWIAVADAKSTPFISMAPKGKDLGNMEFSWQVDGYTAPQAGGTQDGTDVNTATAYTASNASSNRQRWKTYAEVFRRFHRTGFVANEMNVAGVGGSETARAVAKRLVEIKRDMEAVFTCTGQAAVLETSSAAFRTSSLGNWLNGSATTYPTVTAGLPTTDYDPESGAVITTATASWTESTIQDVLAAIYGGTGQFREYDAILGTKLKRAFTDLCKGKVANLGTPDANGLAATSVRTFNTEMSTNTITAKIDVFEGDFGTIRLHPSTFLNTISGSSLTPNAFKGYIIPFEMVEVRYAALPKVLDLPDAGGGPIKLIQAIAGLCVKNCQGFGMFNGTA